MKIALAGNPNSGKTTLYNGLTGSTEKVGNWAGVTVDIKAKKLKASLNEALAEDESTGQGSKWSKDEPVMIVDLPGAYSITAYSTEEGIARDFILNENPDVIVNIVDSINLKRSLLFTIQLLELGIPVVVALNKEDLCNQKGIEIDKLQLSKDLNCPVIAISANKEDSSQLRHLVTMAKANARRRVDKRRNMSDQEVFALVDKIVANIERRKTDVANLTWQDKLDRVIAGNWLGLPFFALVMWAVFGISQTYVGPFIAEKFTGLIDSFGAYVGGLIEGNVAPIWEMLLVDGIIGGVGAVVGFLPLIMVMFFLLSLLEDCGYMARVAALMDRYFKKVGLSGKSIIPMVMGTACAIPGVMAARTIKDEKQRRMTVMLTPFMPCGAKLPVIALFAGAFFANQNWVGVLMYFAGIALIVIGALLIKAITGAETKKSYFIMEFPEYKLPSIKRATMTMLARGKAFVVKAGTIILVCNALIMLMQSFDFSFNLVGDDASSSILAKISQPVAVLLIPLGFGVWKLAAAAITGFIAKENVVGTLAVVYGISRFIDEDFALVGNGSGTEVAAIMGITSVAALSYLMFNLFTPPCFAAIGAMASELESKKWLAAGIALQLCTGYVVSFLVYQIGTFVTTGSVGAGFVGGLIATLTMVGIVVALVVRRRMKWQTSSLAESSY